LQKNNHYWPWNEKGEVKYKLREEQRDDRKAMRSIASQKQNIKLTRLKRTQRVCEGDLMIQKALRNLGEL